MMKSRVAAISLLLVSAAILCEPVAAQQPAATPINITSSDEAGLTSSAQPADKSHRIIPGDILNITITGCSSSEVTVDISGAIRLPLIHKRIQASCKTEDELARIIPLQYLSHHGGLQVSVSLQKHSPEVVTIIGAVEKPARFILQRRVRLRELLAFAGGSTAGAKGIVELFRHEGAAVCDAPDGKVISGKRTTPHIVSYLLKDVLSADDASNPYVQPGDFVNVPDAGHVYIIGNVFKPQAITLRGPVTVFQAIEISGGPLRSARTDRLRIHRRIPGSTSLEVIPIDLKAIQKGKAEDFLLQADDVIIVPSNRSLEIGCGLQPIAYIIR